jgi:CHASE2 domain-containing sensor protein
MQHKKRKSEANIEAEDRKILMAATLLAALLILAIMLASVIGVIVAQNVPFPANAEMQMIFAALVLIGILLISIPMVLLVIKIFVEVFEKEEEYDSWGQRTK